MIAVFVRDGGLRYLKLAFKIRCGNQVSAVPAESALGALINDGKEM